MLIFLKNKTNNPDYFETSNKLNGMIKALFSTPIFTLHVQFIYVDAQMFVTPEGIPFLIVQSIVQVCVHVCYFIACPWVPHFQNTIVFCISKYQSIKLIIKQFHIFVPNLTSRMYGSFLLLGFQAVKQLLKVSLKWSTNHLSLSDWGITKKPTTTSTITTTTTTIPITTTLVKDTAENSDENEPSNGNIDGKDTSAKAEAQMSASKQVFLFNYKFYILPSRQWSKILMLDINSLPIHFFLKWHLPNCQLAKAVCDS